ncbi:hypothetical protein EDD76_12152 [Kineothrix alysoides]|uniref:TadE-like protein n=2 Tax=Kineothrix alysoides TaxID=1469948 RepID=A0A4V2QAY4_9FIRM|nr:hypothetical protein EDD76_12152 [Kineothrix alysoides]
MSFFWIKKAKNYNHIKNQAILRAMFSCTILINKLSLFKMKSEKRTSFFPFLNCKASMTVEAALAVPFFLFFIMNILVIFDMLRLHGNIEEAIHQTGNQMAFCGYAYKNVEELGFSLPDEMSSIAMSEVYARGRVIRILGTDYLNNTCLSSGAAGLHFVKSSVMKEDDVIDFIVSYKVKPLIGIIGFADFPMENRYYGRAWTGYDVENGQGGQEDDPIVFIAENGVVYHTSRNCTYLCPSINMISAFQKDNIRNEQGEKYHACERCGRAGIQGVLYITSQGNRYHNSLKCSGLKRTIYAVHLSETGGKGKCSKCG